MSLDQLMAFTVNPDHARQAEVWEALQRTPIREPYQIRRMLTESAVRASDKRAQFVGVADYEAAGGIVLRDLFESDDGGWLQDPALLERLVAEKLEREAETIRAEGWNWVEVAPDFPYGHTYGLRRLSGKEVPPTKKAKARDALKAELERLEKKYADAEEIPDEVDARLGEIETALGEFDQRPSDTWLGCRIQQRGPSPEGLGNIPRARTPPRRKVPRILTKSGAAEHFSLVPSPDARTAASLAQKNSLHC